MLLAGLCVILLTIWTLFAYSAIPLPINDSLFAWVRRQWLMEGTTLLVVVGVFAIMWANRRRVPALMSWWNAWWVWIGWAGLSMWYSIDRDLSLRAWIMFLSYGLLAYVAQQVVRTPRDLQTWTCFLVAVAAVVSVEGLFQYFGSFDTTLRLMERLQAAGQLDVRGWNIDVFRDFLVRKRIFSVFGWPNLFAGFLLLIIPLAIGLCLGARNLLARWGWALIAGELGICLLLTLSMGAWIAAILTGGLIWWMMHRPVGRSGPSEKRGVNGPLRGLLITGLLIAMLWGTSFIVAKRARPFIAASTHSRVVYVQGALNILRAFPLQGTGFGTFGIAYRALMPREEAEGQHTAIHAHNTLLQVGAELGVIGLVLFGWLLWRIGRLVRGSLTGGIVTRDPVRWGLAVGILAFFVHSILEQTFFEGVTAPFWWIVLGLLSGAATIGQPVERLTDKGPTHLARALLPVMASCAVFLMALRLALADACAALGGFKNFEGRQEEVMLAFDQARQWDPLASRYPFEQGQWLAKRAQGQPSHERTRLLEQAQQHFEQTVTLNPWQGSAWLSLGIVQQQLGRIDDAIISLRHAAQRDPNSRVAAFQLIEWLGMTGRFEEMASAAQRYQQLEPSDSKGLFLEAMAWQNLRQPDHAEHVYQTLLQHHPDHYAAWFNLAELLRQAGRAEAATAAYARFLQVAPADQTGPREAAQAFLNRPSR